MVDHNYPINHPAAASPSRATVGHLGAPAESTAASGLPAPDPAAHAYPRPQLCRERWWSLNGTWDFCLDPEGLRQHASDVEWNSSIVVPFAPETPASGVHEQGFHRACWYRRSFEAPALAKGERLILHFGAVDFYATVAVNEVEATRHIGGYTPFSTDITKLLVPGVSQTVTVHAQDDPHDLTKPRGKQDWLLEPHAIWYPRTTGIWQTVWLEVVPAVRIHGLRWGSNLERWEVELEATIDAGQQEGLRLHLRLSTGETVLVEDDYSVVAGEVHRRIGLSDPGADDYRNELLWSPRSPTLIDAEVELRGPDGELLDAVTSYTALRQVDVQGDRFFLNNRPYQLRLVLDQGYWPETGLTAPADEAFRLDVELAKAMGFNGVRKHQKIEDPRFLLWADRLGLLVWAEQPSTYRFTRRAIERITREWGDVLDRDVSHPCIVTWVPFNESSGVPDLSSKEAQRHFVDAIYHLTRSIDPSRPVVGNDGWENLASTDMVGIHDYDDAETLRARYESEELLPKLFSHQRFGGRPLLLEDAAYAGQPIVLSEFGGLALSDDHERTWGYRRAGSPEELAEAYSHLLETVRAVTFFAGFCYTQFTDTYQETNGLLYADRTPKIPLEVIAAATEPPW